MYFIIRKFYISVSERNTSVFKLSRSQNILKDWHLLKNETPKGFKKFFEKDPRQQPKQAPPKGKRLERPKGLSSLAAAYT